MRDLAVVGQQPVDLRAIEGKTERTEIGFDERSDKWQADIAKPDYAYARTLRGDGLPQRFHMRVVGHGDWFSRMRHTNVNKFLVSQAVPCP